MCESSEIRAKWQNCHFARTWGLILANFNETYFEPILMILSTLYAFWFTSYPITVQLSRLKLHFNLFWSVIWIHFLHFWGRPSAGLTIRIAPILMPQTLENLWKCIKRSSKCSTVDLSCAFDLHTRARGEWSDEKIPSSKMQESSAI